MFTRGMLSTCLSNYSTVVWTWRPFTRGLLGTKHIAWVAVAIMYFELQWQSLEVTGIDRSMSIINMLRFLMCTCWLCVNYFELYMLYQTCMLTFTLYILTLF
ncbi:hypothetical protein Hanom_Chr03g00243431 [Helianthus anomalus]